MQPSTNERYLVGNRSLYKLPVNMVEMPLSLNIRPAKIQLLFKDIRLTYAVFGEVAERSNAAVLKTVEGLSPPRVRIPASPPSI